MAKKKAVLPTAYEVSARVTRQASIRPYQRDSSAPVSRPLRIYTLDPSVSDRLGGVAIAQVPYEPLTPGPVGSVFKVSCEGAPAPITADALDLDDPFLLLSSGLSPSPSNGRFHLQMVYAVCSLTYTAFSRSFRRREIFPDHVLFMTEDAVRWEPPEDDLCIPELAFKKLKFDGEPGRPASERELERQAHVLGRVVTDPANAGVFRLVSASQPLPKGIVQAPPAMVESVRVARRAAPDGRILFDLVAEVTQTCTVKLKDTLFEMNGGCTVVIDPQGQVRYAIYKRLTSENRRARQHAAMSGPLKAFWKKSNKRFTLLPNVLRRVHSMA